MENIEKIQVSSISDFERELQITVTQEHVSKEYEQVVKFIQQRASHPGFRPGKVPTKMLPNLFAQQIQKEILSRLIEKTLFVAIKKHDLEPISQPQTNFDNPVHENNSFSYTARFEIKPKLNNISCADLNLEFKNYIFNEEDVNKNLAAIQKKYMTFLEPKDREIITDQDIVYCSTSYIIDNKPYPELNKEEAPIALFEENISPNFKKALLGKKAGEQAIFEEPIPDNYHDESLRGKTCQTTLDIISFKEHKLPALDDDFAKDVDDNISSLVELKNKIRDHLTKEADKRKKNWRQQTIVEALIKANPCELPQSLVSRYAWHIADRKIASFANDKKQIEELRKKYGPVLVREAQEQAKSQAHADIIFAELIQELKLTADEDEIKSLTQENKYLDKETAEYQIQLEKIFSHVEKLGKTTTSDEQLFKQTAEESLDHVE